MRAEDPQSKHKSATGSEAGAPGVERRRNRDLLQKRADDAGGGPGLRPHEHAVRQHRDGQRLRAMICKAVVTLAREVRAVFVSEAVRRYASGVKTGARS